MAEAAHAAHALPADVRGKHRPETVPPETHRFMTDIDPAFEEQILDIAQRQGNLMSIMTTRPITPGDELKRRNGLGGRARDLRGIFGR